MSYFTETEEQLLDSREKNMETSSESTPLIRNDSNGGGIMANALPGQRVINGRNGYSALEDGITTPVVTDDDGDHERDRYVFPKKKEINC